MWNDPDICYQAMLARDARFDGRFFVAVKSTGIYCRPICRVRTPRRENCTFYGSAAAAEAQGYRPCLRCRPELAPGHASVDAAGRLANRAAGLIEDGAAGCDGLESLASRLGTSSRHLRRVFADQFGVAPVAYAQTQRLLLAKRLLTDTRLAVTQVALASGFKSVRRFNALFRQRYRMRPRDLRRTPEAQAPGQLLFELAYRPPYDWTRLLAFLSARCIPGVEAVRDGRYLRTVRIDRGRQSHRGWISVSHRPRRHTLGVALSDSLACVVPEVLARVKDLFDLSCRPDEISKHLGALAAGAPGLRVPGAFDGFEVAVRAVLGQQVTVASARTMAARLANAFGSPIKTPLRELELLFPAPVDLLALDGPGFGATGIFRSRQRAIRALAEACAAKAIDLRPAADAEVTIQKLLAMPGIGDWTAQYIAMRALRHPDAFLHTDCAVIKALGRKSAGRVLKMSQPWRPWRAYAVVHLWNSLSLKEQA